MTAETNGPGREPLPEFDASRPRTEQGLYRKFNVSRVDGSDGPGGKHDGCDYFVIDRTHDKYASAALLAYAAACEAEYPMLAADLRSAYGATSPAPAKPPYSVDLCSALRQIADSNSDLIRTERDWCIASANEIERLWERALQADTLPDAQSPPAPVARETSDENARHAIDGAMAKGAANVDPAPAGHWLEPYWRIGRELAIARSAATQINTAANAAQQEQT